jgi:hypothetical protein
MEVREVVVPVEGRRLGAAVPLPSFVLGSEKTERTWQRAKDAEAAAEST